jgi:hypothetical protein
VNAGDDMRMRDTAHAGTFRRSATGRLDRRIPLTVVDRDHHVVLRAVLPDKLPA